MRVFLSILVVVAALLAAAGPALAQGSTTYVDSQTLLDAFGKKGGALAKGEQFSVSPNRRTANGNVEIHEKETDIFFVVDGSATLVTGGTAVEQRQTRPGQFTAKGIDGGQTYNLKKGDVVVIPAGQPHWFKEVHGFINYVTVKSIKP